MYDSGGGALHEMEKLDKNEASNAASTSTKAY